MRYFLSELFVFCALTALATTAVAREAEPPIVEFFIAPAGDDSNPGTVDQPFASLTRARNAVRDAKRRTPKPSSVTVQLRGGTYFLPGMFNILAHDTGMADLPVIWRSYGDERAVLVAARDVGGFAPAPDDPGTLVADLPPPSLDIDVVPLKQLFHVGPEGWERLTPARHPNVDPANPGSGWARAAGTAPGTAAKPGDEAGTKSLVVEEADARPWKRAADGEVSVFATHDWWNSLVRVNTYEAATRTLRFHEACSARIRPGDPYFVQGMREDLDAPGEWYYDKSKGKLFVRPPREVDPAAFRVVAPNARSIITIGPNVQNVRLEGLEFHGCEGTAVFLLNATSCTVASCSVSQAGGYYGAGVAIVNGKDNLVAGCDVSFTGGTGIILAGGRLDRRERAGHRAENNVVHHTGVICKHGAAIGVGGYGSTASHNLVHDCPRSGIIVTGNEHLVEGNRVERTCLETNEAAAISAEGGDFVSGRGNIIRHNLVRDAIGFGRDDKGNWRSPAIAWGISLDHGAVAVEVIGNIVMRAGRAGIRLDNARHCRVVNNLLVDAGSDAALAYEGWKSDDSRWVSRLPEMKLRHAVIAKAAAWKDAPDLATGPADAVLPDGCTSAGNEFTRNIVVSRAPAVPVFRMRNLPVAGYRSDSNLLYVVDAAGTPVPPVVSVEPSWPGGAEPRTADTFAAWQKLAFDAASILADPRIENLTSGDFRLKSDSPAATLGFEPIPIDSIGPKPDSRSASGSATP